MAKHGIQTKARAQNLQFRRPDDSCLPEAELLHCSRLVQEFNLRQVRINHVSEVKELEEVGELDSAYLEVDLLDLEGMKAAKALEELCRRARIDKQGRGPLHFVRHTQWPTGAI